MPAVHTCAVWNEGQGNVRKLYEYSERETGGSKGTLVWESDNVPCPMNILTAGTMLTVAVTYVLQCTQGTYVIYVGKKEFSVSGWIFFLFEYVLYSQTLN